MTDQLTFALPSKPALGREDFFVSPANEIAVATLDGWQDWPERKLALSGPAGSGKTHLVHVWAASSGAAILPASDLGSADIADLATRCVAVEDVPDCAGNAEIERALFHLHNLCLAEGNAVLVTGRTPPARWPIDLPDLASRMQGTGVAILDPPDDNLLAAVVAKLFADRQLDVAPDVIGYITRRMDRSFQAARRIVDRLDGLSLAEHRAITKPLAARVLAPD